jgi:hypothetical protein
MNEMQLFYSVMAGLSLGLVALSAIFASYDKKVVIYGLCGVVSVAVWTCLAFMQR